MMSERLRALHDAQLRGHRPEVPPVGAVIEQDGPLIRTHYGTHGSIDYRNIPATGLDTLIARQRDAFAARGERGDWKIYAHDAPADLPGRLRAAGFTPGWERALLVASLDQVAVASPAKLREVHEDTDHERVALLAAGAGPQRTAFTEYLTDGRLMSWDAAVLAPASGASIDAAAWAEHIPGTGFVVIEGIVDPDLTLAPYLSGYDWRRRGRPGWIRRPDARYLLAEADGGRRAALERAGFQPITTATSYHWTPPSPPVTTRPVELQFKDEVDRPLWDRLTAEFGFQPSTKRFPGITEPPASVTWRLGTLRSPNDAGELQAVVERGLLACVPAGEALHWLDWQHVGYRFDPGRVGRAGQPPIPGGAFPDGDYYLYVTADLRLGTFGHPWEHTVCVFGAELLAQVEADLTDLLDAALRRGGHPDGTG